MRKLIFSLLALALLLTACGRRQAPQTYTVERFGRTYTVDWDAQTVVYEGVTYTFALESSGAGYTVIFTAPDGTAASWSQSENFGSGSWGDGWDESVYLSDLAEAVELGRERSGARSGNSLAGLLLMAVGAFNALAPHAAWYLSHGWKYKDAEPSDAALGLSRIGGVASIVLGAVLFFI